ncbi:MAG: hypothetical protein NZ849_11575 [Meiothermus sp.]|uniref:hypothetical protein n=1 Tax=Thermaceae TaxID=188786 RepID=UPI0025EDB54E|nr:MULTISPECIES: hypothetical protein [Thermaceae]MCS7059097.1 hypothetical protein [Meiothermus sp.]MCS7195531.1 hypothetical protein [Meiothermus sp.]MCX7850300.1 hypothetical protein [Thermus sp.]MDW8090459.1 hypothetical protein [Meiothermus sp.]MDW8481040.1 hypothetical protein [Meiothermus sp.]
MLELRFEKPPFLELLRQGRVSERAFVRWLSQERHLLEALLTLEARLLSKAPQPHRLIWVNGLWFAVEELDWLAVVAPPEEPPHPLRTGYLRYLRALAEEPYGLGVAACWARQRVFLDAWGWLGEQGLEGGPSLVHQALLRWSAPELEALARDLRSLVVELPGGVSLEQAGAVIEQVRVYEQLGWAMALGFAREALLS